VGRLVFVIRQTISHSNRGEPPRTHSGKEILHLVSMVCLKHFR